MKSNWTRGFPSWKRSNTIKLSLSRNVASIINYNYIIKIKTVRKTNAASGSISTRSIQPKSLRILVRATWVVKSSQMTFVFHRHLTFDFPHMPGLKARHIHYVHYFEYSICHSPVSPHQNEYFWSRRWQFIIWTYSFLFRLFLQAVEFPVQFRPDVSPWSPSSKNYRVHGQEGRSQKGWNGRMHRYTKVVCNVL